MAVISFVHGPLSVASKPGLIVGDPLAIQGADEQYAACLEGSVLLFIRFSRILCNAGFLALDEILRITQIAAHEVLVWTGHPPASCLWMALCPLGCCGKVNTS